MQHDATCDWLSEDFGGLSDVSAPAEPTGAGVFHLGDNDEGGDFDSWTLGHLPDGHIGTPVESESVLERCVCACPHSPSPLSAFRRGLSPKTY